jgi:hypothetical protein
MKKLSDIRTATYVFLTIIVTMFIITSGIAHCTSPETDQQIVSLYIKHHNTQISPESRIRISRHIVYTAETTGIPYEIITAIMRAESCYDPNAVGPMGEIGLMQVYDTKCAGFVFKPGRLFEIEYNITAGVCILLEKLVLSKGNILEAVRRYNGSGPGARAFQAKVCGYILDIMRFRVASNKEYYLQFGQR